MANAEQLALLKAGVEGWNKWRQDDRHQTPIDLVKADLRVAKLSEADFIGYNAVFDDDYAEVNLSEAKLSEADLRNAHLRGANLSGADLSEAELTESDLRVANLRGANLRKADLEEAWLTQADLREANLSGSDLSKTYLSEADLREAYLFRANLSEADLSKANLSEANLSQANFSGANLTDANLSRANLSQANLIGVNLSRADLIGTNLFGANLSEADLSEAKLSEADLSHANLVKTNISNAKISESKVYSVNVWDLKGEFKEQKDLIITPQSQPSITVDNIQVAQFVYLILNNKEIRRVIDTLTSKAVLILGRFALPERKAILDALRNKLREYDLLPIVFDFDRPTDKDFTETIKTLAGMSYFVIADVTNPKSSPLELQATVPDYQIPFVPIIQEGEYPFAMMVDLQKKYDWVLDTISYDSLDTLIEILKPHIIDPAIKKRDELRIQKATEPTIISGKNLLSK